MSYEEVERGLPPVDIVGRPMWRDLFYNFSSNRVISPPPLRYETNPNWLSPGHNTIQERARLPPSPPIKRRPSYPSDGNDGTSTSSSSDGGFTEKPTRRYFIQDEDSENDMKVIPLEPDQSVPGTLEVSPPSSKIKPPPGVVMNRQVKGATLEIPKLRVTAASPSPGGSIPSLSQSSKVIARRAKNFVICLLTFLPPLFLTIGVEFLHNRMASYGIPLLGICIFQPVFWSAFIFLLFSKIWVRSFSILTPLMTCWAELLCLALLVPGAIIFQLFSLLYLDLMISLALTFPPIVFAILIDTISSDRHFSIELCLTSIVTYLGVALIGVSGLYIQFRDTQKDYITGFAASMGCAMLTIPCSLLVFRLRRKEVDDSISISILAIFGTIVSIAIGLWIGFLPKMELDPALISSLVTFIFFGTIFQFIESKLNPKNLNDAKQVIGVQYKQRHGYLRISRTRLGIFLMAGAWEVLTLGLKPAKIYLPPAFSIFGVTFILIGYLLTVTYQLWLRNKTIDSCNFHRLQLSKNGGDGIRRNRFLCLPWLFYRKSN